MTFFFLYTRPKLEQFVLTSGYSAAPGHDPETGSREAATAPEATATAALLQLQLKLRTQLQLKTQLQLQLQLHIQWHAFLAGQVFGE